jgi:hypothetical protein
MECYYLSRPVDEARKPRRGYRKRMYGFWKERGMFAVSISEQRLCDQARAILRNGWLTKLELEDIRRRMFEGSMNESRDNCEAREGEVGESEIQLDQDQSLDTCNTQENCDMIRRPNDLTGEEEKFFERLIRIIEEERVSGVKVKSYKYKYADQRKLNEEVERMNKLVERVMTSSISMTNELIRAVGILVAENLGLKEQGGNTTRKEPWWKRRIEGNIRKLSGHISMMDRMKRGELKRMGVIRMLERKYWIKRKGLSIVLEELKQRVIAKRAKLKRYEQRVRQYQQNKLFKIDQKKVYQELNGIFERGEKIVPDASESVAFWGEIWSKEKNHNMEAGWLKDMKLKVNYEKQLDVSIDVQMIKSQCKRIPNWKTAGLDGVQGFWIKRLSSCHERIAEQLNEIVSGDVELPEWMTCGRTFLCLKDPARGSMVDNFRPITCLPLMWKLLTGMIADRMYDHLVQNEILPVEQKGCRKRSKGTKDQLLIDKLVLRDCKRRHTNLAMAWVDYRKAYDMVPHSWIMECLKMFGCASNITKFIGRSMEMWKTELISNGEKLGCVGIRRGIFQGDSLSPLLFVLCLIPLTLILREAEMGYIMKDKKTKINHLLYMDDLKVYGKSEVQMGSLVSSIHMFSEDIGMEFGVKKCGVLVMRRGKISDCEGIVLPNGDVMKSIEDEGYKYLGILELDDIMEEEMRSKITKEYFRRLKLILKSKLHGRNKIQAINTWAVAVLRYGGGIVKWCKTELEKMDRKTRKMLTMYGALHPKSDVDRLYLTRKKGGRGLIGCKRCIDAEVNNLGWYVKNSIEPLLQEVSIEEM